MQPCDMRKGLDGLAAQVQSVLAADPFSGALFIFRGSSSMPLTTGPARRHGAIRRPGQRLNPIDRCFKANAPDVLWSVPT